MYLTEAEVKIEEDSDNLTSKKNEQLPHFRIKRQGMRSQKRQKQSLRNAANQVRRS